MEVPIVARHSWHMKFVAALFLGAGTILAGLAFDAGQVVGIFADRWTGAVGLALIAAGTAYWIHLSDSVACTDYGLTHSRLLRSTRTLAWHEIDRAVDRESALVLVSTSRGRSLRVSRWVPRIDAVFERLRHEVDFEALLTAQVNSAPRRLAAAWHALAGPLLIASIGISLAVWAVGRHDWRIALLSVLTTIVAGWNLPETSLEIQGHQFVFQRYGKSRVVPLEDVSAIDLGSTEFRTKHGGLAAMLTFNKIVVVRRAGRRDEFTPRCGAFVASIIANRTLEAWRANQVAQA